jgi:hypothetical protein
MMEKEVRVYRQLKLKFGERLDTMAFSLFESKPPNYESRTAYFTAGSCSLHAYC